MNDTQVTVIGGGASGMMAAITAARCGASVRILEHMDRVGKKILSTGNGKCNYTNSRQELSWYRGEDPAFALPVLAQLDHRETVKFFEELGIYPKEKNGYFYPAGGQASSVLDALRMECDYQKVETITACEVLEMEKCKNGYRIQTDKGAFYTASVIFATGLLAAPKTGSDGSAIPHIERLGHHFIDIVPALVQLQGKQSFFKSVAGIRAECEVSLFVENEQIQSDTGELQLTDYGISGIPVFQISRYATRALSQGKEVHAELNFLPWLNAPQSFSLLRKRFFKYHHEKNAAEALSGLVHKKLADMLLKESRIDRNMRAADVRLAALQRLCDTMRALRVDITGSNGMEAAQVCAGGVDTREVNGETLESKSAPGVYFAGEVLDIDGACGGYNLQWAWSSGYVAGVHAAARSMRDGSEKRGNA